MTTLTHGPGLPVMDSDLRTTRHVIVPVDGSTESISALMWLIEHGNLHAGQLRLVTAETGGITRHDAQQAIAATPELTHHHRVWLDDAPWYGVQSAPLLENAAIAIMRVAGPDDIIVIGGKPSTHTGGLMSRTLPLRLAALSRVPVIVVPEDRSPVAAETVHLLVGDDDEWDEPLRYAATEALRRSTPLHLLHGWNVASLYPVELAAQSASHDQLQRAANATIDAAQRRAEADYPGLRIWCQALEGRVPAVLLGALDRAGIAVVGRRGSGAVRQMVLGSVALDLIATLPCPVAVVPLERWQPEH